LRSEWLSSFAFFSLLTQAGENINRIFPAASLTGRLNLTKNTEKNILLLKPVEIF